MTVRLEIHDSHRGELSGRVEAWLEGGGVWATGPDGKETQQGTRIGYVDFSEYDNEIWIKYVHVQPEYRRRGVATAMYEKLKAEFPGEQIVSSGTTGEGGELRKSLKERGVIAADEALDYGEVINVLHSLMPDVDPSLPEPQIRIADYTRSKWLGRTEWRHGEPNTTIVLQKAICHDEETLRRIIAHELVHHEQMLKVWSTYPGGKVFDRIVRIEGGHGGVFKEIANRWNAKHGKDFITNKSDESYEKQFTERPFFVLVSRTSWGSPRWQASIRISGKQKIWMSGKNMEEYRLTQTTDQDFVDAPNIGSRHWEYPHKDNHGLILAAEALMKMPDLRLQWDEKPPASVAEERAKRQEIYEKMREWSRSRRQKKTEKWFQDLKDRSDAYQQSKASAVNTQPTPEVLDEARALRTELRMGDTTAVRGQGNCGFIADSASKKYGWDVYAGLYLEDNGKQIDHVWNVSEDGTIIDITHDQFGPPDINVVKPGQPGYDDYHAYCWQYLPEDEANACPICGNGVVNEESQPDEDMEELKKTSSQKVGLDAIRKQARVSQNLTWLVNYLTMSRRDMGEGYSLSDEYVRRYDELNDRYGITWKDSFRYMETVRQKQPISVNQIEKIDIVDKSIKTADSHKQTPHRENDFESLSEGEGLEGYANQPECEGGNKAIIPMNVLEEQAKLTMTASPVAHFPSWDEFVKKEGGIEKIVNGFGSSWDQWEPYDRAETEAFDALEQKEQQEYLERRAYEDLENRYYDVLGDHSMWSFPLDVYRVVTLKDIRGLKRRGIGVFWSRDENAAEAHWGNFGPGYQKYIIHAQVQEQDVDWEATVWVNLDPSLGEEEKEIRLKEGTHPQILGWKGTSENSWHQPPAAWKNVTASSSWVIPKEAATVGYVYHVTYANRLEDIIWQGLEPGHPPVIGENYGWHTEGRIFFSDPRGVGFWVSRVEEWAYHNSDIPVSDGMIPVVLRIKEYKRYGFEEDEYGTGDAGAEAFFTQKTIPASRIEMWDGKVWRKLNEDLLEELGLVRFGMNEPDPSWDLNGTVREKQEEKAEKEGYLDEQFGPLMNPRFSNES
jgi:GNAT superfamily N-acetyltransferase